MNYYKLIQNKKRKKREGERKKKTKSAERKNVEEKQEEKNINKYIKKWLLIFTTYIAYNYFSLYVSKITS